MCRSPTRTEKDSRPLSQALGSLGSGAASAEGGSLDGICFSTRRPPEGSDCTEDGQSEQQGSDISSGIADTREEKRKATGDN